jgi:hypothetical protein
MDFEPRIESFGASGDLLHFTLSLLFLFLWGFEKKGGVGVNCFIREFTGNKDSLCNSKREKSVWAMSDGSCQGDDVFLSLSTSAHLRGVGGKSGS